MFQRGERTSTQDSNELLEWHALLLCIYLERVKKQCMANTIYWEVRSTVDKHGLKLCQICGSSGLANTKIDRNMMQALTVCGGVCSKISKPQWSFKQRIITTWRVVNQIQVLQSQPQHIWITAHLVTAENSACRMFCWQKVHCWVKCHSKNDDFGASECSESALYWNRNTCSCDRTPLNLQL
jgi:hypothetical protein